MAHAGVVAVVRSDAGGARRFRRVRSAGERLLAEIGPPPSSSRPPSRSTRLYGGFAFRDDHAPEGVWEDFPPALFHLPRVELRSAGSGVSRLFLRASAGEGDTTRVRERLEADLEEVVGRLVTEVDPREPPRVDGEPPGQHGVESDRGAWERAVEETLQAIHEGRISKAVLARTLDLSPGRPIDPGDVALALWRQSRGTHAFLFEPRQGRFLVGGAPETVATVRGERFHATAVAGSTRRGESSEDQRRLARELLNSAKDREEQRVVVEDVVERLRPMADEIRVQEEPHVLTLARIQHLETEIRARLRGGRHVLDVVEALHPTPAVCGVPRDRALEVLREEEPFDRGWYAGPVGWFDDHGDGVLVPALRCAVGSGDGWRLFAGAGIVDGSRPSAEWEETAIKFEPVLRAIATTGEPG